jgi:hypothetical protein
MESMLEIKMKQYKVTVVFHSSSFPTIEMLFDRIPSATDEYIRYYGHLWKIQHIIWNEQGKAEIALKEV